MKCNMNLNTVTYLQVCIRRRSGVNQMWASYEPGVNQELILLIASLYFIEPGKHTLICRASTEQLVISLPRKNEKPIPANGGAAACLWSVNKANKRLSGRIRLNDGQQGHRGNLNINISYRCCLLKLQPQPPFAPWHPDPLQPCKSVEKESAIFTFLLNPYLYQLS